MLKEIKSENELSYYTIDNLYNQDNINNTISVKVTFEGNVLIAETNIKILKNEEWAGRFNIGDDVFEQFAQLHERFDLLTEELDDLNKEYAIVIEMTSEFKNEMDRISHEKNDST